MGATSRVYPCGDVVIKVALESPEGERAVAIDAAMNPVARDRDVRVPALIAFDDSRRLLPVPYAIYQRVHGAIPVERLAGPPGSAQGAWMSIGEELARVHAVSYGEAMPVRLREFHQSPEVDPRSWVAELRDRYRLAPVDASWLFRLLDALAPAALAGVPLHLCHGDVNASNVLVDEATGMYRALIDWSGAGWLDPVWDFAGVPLAVVPWMLAAHRAIALLPHDGTAEARILWCQVQTRLFNATRQGDDDVARCQLADGLRGVRAFVEASGLTGDDVRL